MFVYEKLTDYITVCSVVKKDVNRDSHIATLPFSQSCFFEEVRCLILVSSQRKLRGFIELLKFHVTVKKKEKFKFV